MSYLGLDIGTSSCKAVVFNDDGLPATRRAVRTYALLSPAEGFAELDPDVVIKSCHEVIAEAAQAVSEPIATICVSSQLNLLTEESFLTTKSTNRPEKIS